MAIAKQDVAANAGTATIGIVGGGPASLVLAIALARRGISTTVFERDLHPDRAPRFHPDRSYTIDTSGHGLRALRHIDATSYFDERVNRFKGIKILGKLSEEWTEPGWTGSRGDYQRALMAIIKDRHQDNIALHFETNVEALDVRHGSVTIQPQSGASTTNIFDLVIGGDGAGSIVRHSLEQQWPGFIVTTKSYPMYCTMIELDRLDNQLDRHYLHMFSIYPFVVAGAIRGDSGPDSTRWFCAVCTNRELKFSSANEAHSYFRARSPRVLEFASEQAVAAFAQRKCYHIGRSLTCSQLHGGKAVLIGDAAAPFPPIGQGLNAALESSMVLDQTIGELGRSPAQVLEAASAFSAKWKPEVEAAAWVAERHLAENRFHNFRARLTHILFGLSVVGETKRSDISYAEVKRKTQRLWPLW
jgi:2-polyprenyl-6-methoxyphenol hydroxylase-like FAD-dependent oxidoreductase